MNSMTNNTTEEMYTDQVHEEDDRRHDTGATRFWNEYLNGSNVQLIVPEHHQQQQTTWAIAECVADADLTVSLRRLLQGGERTMNELLLSCIALLLSRWSRETDMTLGLELVSENEVLQYFENRRVSEAIFPVRLDIKEEYDIYSLMRHVSAQIRYAATNCTGSYDVISKACPDVAGCFQAGFFCSDGDAMSSSVRMISK